MKRAILLLGLSLFSALSFWAQETRPAPDAAQEKRERDLRMPDIVQALGVTRGARIADIGAGGGDYEPALSRAVGVEGRVYAEDIDGDALKRLRERMKKGEFGNVDVIEGVADDPKLPGNLDAVIMVITYHEVNDSQKMLEHVAAALKRGGRFVVVDMAPHKTLTRPRADQVKNHVIAPDIAESEILSAGFEVISRDDHFIDKPDEESTRWTIVFRKLGASGRL